MIPAVADQAISALLKSREAGGSTFQTWED
jgi:hypothetical protein